MDAEERRINIDSSDLSSILFLRHYFMVVNFLVAKNSDHEEERERERNWEKEVREQSVTLCLLSQVTSP